MKEKTVKTDLVEVHRVRVLRGIGVDPRTGEVVEILGRGRVHGKEVFLVLYPERIHEEVCDEDSGDS